MKLLLSKPIVGIIDRGLPTENRHTYANPGDTVEVIFDNTGHYVCIKDDLDFIVFNSQFDTILNERERKDDILYPESTEDFED